MTYSGSSLGLRRVHRVVKLLMLTCNFAFSPQNVQSDPAEKRRGGVHPSIKEHPFQGCCIYSGW